MKKLTRKNGVALILTISVLTALTILGISFVALLHRDTKNQEINADIQSASGAMDAAINIGIDEIQSQLALDKNYFYSEIESADPSDAGVPDSSLYFKTIIKATNAKLSLYQSSCEVYNVFPYLIDEMPDLSASLKTDAENIYKSIAIYQSSWDMKFISDFMKVKKAGIAEQTNAEIYANIADYITINPKGEEGKISNIIDYGRCLSFNAGNSTFQAENRDFAPLHSPSSFSRNYTALRGAKVEIIAGTGYDPNTPSYGIIDKVDSTDRRILHFRTWIGNTPDADSIYRIYSYVTPINFNAASSTLINAQIKCILPALEEILDKDYSIFNNLGLYDSVTSVTFMGKLYDFRNGATRVVIDNMQTFKTDYLQVVFGINTKRQKEILSRQFDPTQPKGIYDGANWRIYPPAVPFCFEHNGYYDMEIEAGFKRNPKSKKAGHIEKRYVTVKVGGVKDHNLREDFASNNGVQHWVSTSDWVPVKFMKDIKNWGTVYMSDFQPYIKDITANSANVFPDSVKNGLWLDFGAGADNRGSDLVYSEISAKLEKAEDLHTSSFFDKLEGETPIINAGQLKIQGVPTGSITPYTPESELIYGTTSGANADKYDFGEVSILVKIEEDAGSKLESSFPHPAAVSWYDGGIDLTTHSLWSEHKNTSTGRESYPPERFFTPTFFIHDDGVNSIDFRTEQKFNNSITLPNTNTCDPDANYITDYVFSVGNGSNYLNENYYYDPGAGSHVYYEKYKLFTAAINFNSDDYLFVSFNPFASPTILNEAGFSFTGNSAIKLSKIDPFSFNKGKLGFKREFPDDYYANDNVRPFSVSYMRIIAGERDDAAGAHTYPYIQSPWIETTDVKTYELVRIYYSIGLNNDGSLPDPFDFKFDLEFKTALDLSGSSDSDITNTPDATIVIDSNTVRPIQGVFECVLDSTASSKKCFNYKINIVNVNGAGDETNRLAFLKSTIAINKVEVFYDTVPEIISKSENL